MTKSKQFTKYFTIYLLVYIFCTSSYVKSEDEEPEEQETTTTEVPPEAPEPVEENYDICDLPYLGSDEPKPVPENLVRMGPNSKYFMLVGVDSIPIKEVAEFCETIGLQPAEVRHNIELASIEMFLKESAPENTVVSLGINDEVEEGSFVEYDGTPMQFHSFAERQPNNRMNAESCITVAPHPNLERLVYNDVTCDTGVTPMCMFPPSSQCFLGSPLTLARVKEGFDLVGSTTLRDYFVSFKQYPRADAADMCLKNGYTLVDFNTGLSNNQIVYDLTTKWFIRNFIFQAIPLWTGGKVVATDTVNPDIGQAGTPQYKFESSGKILSDLSEWPSLAWDNEEPSDASGLGLENCISAILYDPYQASGDNVFTLATTNCRLPHYALCYQEKTVEPVNVTKVEEAECNDTETEGMMGRSLGDDDRGHGRFCTIEDVKVNLSLPQLTTDELLSIAAATRHKPLGTDEYRIKWALEKDWLSKFTDQVYKVPKEFCPLNYIPSAYMNIMHNMIILYFNSVFAKVRDPDPKSQAFLLEQAEIFEKCAKKLRPATFESAGGLPTKYKGYPVNPIEELIEDEAKAGKNYIPDMIIDTFWYFFQITVASCWGETEPGGFPSRTFNLQRIHHLFTTHFLHVFEQRWFSPLTEVDYGVIVGDMDIDTAYYTMKSCALAAFINSNISELYFPRPVYIPGITSERINEKYQSPILILNNKEK